MSSQYYKVTAYAGVPHAHEVEVTIPLVGPQGPAGPAGSGLEALTTLGDTLYRGASTGERLPIGTTGQVLKVSAQGLPAWANESGAVTSVNGATGAVVLDAEDVGAQISLEYISQSIDAVGNINAAVNKFYTLTKNISDNVSVRLPENANVGDRVVVFRALGTTTAGLILVDKPTGFPSPPFASIGVLRGTNHVFYAVYTNGSWRADFIPPAGFQSAPTSVSDFGVSGQMGYADPHLYICVAPNTWRRLTLTTF